MSMAHTKKFSHRQVQAIKISVANPQKSKGWVLRQAGFSEAVARHPERVFGKRYVIRELTRRGVRGLQIPPDPQPKEPKLSIEDAPVNIPEPIIATPPSLPLPPIPSAPASPTPPVAEQNGDEKLLLTLQKFLEQESILQQQSIRVAEAESLSQVPTGNGTDIFNNWQSDTGSAPPLSSFSSM